MPGHDIIVIGASAGGVETLSRLVRSLPSDLPAALFVVLHVPDNSTSVLPQILSRAGSLPAAHGDDRTPIRPGHIYVAPPGQHLLVRRGRISLQRGPRIHGHRPAVDALFQSAALSYGPQVVSVILSGTLSDGSAGTASVKAAGGIAVVQDPNDALYAGMPENAIASARVDHILPLAEIPALLVRLAGESVQLRGEEVWDSAEEQEARVAQDMLAQEEGGRVNQPSVLTCPDCGGVLWEISNGQLIEYRCHVGHVYGIDSLAEHQTQAVESALWTAIRSLSEREVLARRLANRAISQQYERAAQQFLDQAEEASQAAAVLRRLIENGEEG